jgi:hypothetical protein
VVLRRQLDQNRPQQMTLFEGETAGFFLFEEFVPPCFLGFTAQMTQVYGLKLGNAIIGDHLKRQSHSGAARESSAQNLVTRYHLPQRLLEASDVQRALEFQHALGTVRRGRSTRLLQLPHPLLLWRKPKS